MIAVVLSQIKLVHDVAYTGPRQIDLVGAILSVRRHGRPRPRHSRLAGRRRVRRTADCDRSGRARAAGLLARAAQAGREADVARSGPVQVPALHDRDLRAAAAERDAGRRDDRAPDLPPDDARVQRDEDGIDPRAALAQHVRRRAARGTQGGRAAPEQHHPGRIRSLHGRDGGDHPDRPAHALGLDALRPVADHGLRARPPRLAAEQLHPLSDRGGAGRARQPE